MKTFLPIKLNALLRLLIICLIAQNAFSQSATTNVSPLPAPTGFVNDYAGVLSAETKQNLENSLKAFKEQTNPQVEIGVAIVKTTEGRDIFDYSLNVARGWGIGSKQTDNPSALLFVAIDDRKYFTQVSRDLEDELPDGLVGQLQRQYLVPAFKRGDYNTGIADTVDAYIRTVKAKQSGEPAPIQQQEKKETRRGSSIGGFGCLIILLVLMLLIFGRGGRGGRGGGGGSFWLPLLLSSILSSSGGSSRGGWGGSSGDSDWGGGSGGWGGFGGGGDFGGGGSGGSW